MKHRMSWMAAATGIVAATIVSGCASGGPKMRREPVGVFSLSRAPEVRTEGGLRLEAEQVTARPAADDGDVLREDWRIVVFAAAADDARGPLQLEPARVRLVIDPVEPAPAAESISMSRDQEAPMEGEDSASDANEAAAPTVPEELEDAGHPAMADDLTSQQEDGGDWPGSEVSSRLDGAVGASVGMELKPANGLFVEGSEVSHLRVAPGEKQRFEVSFSDVPAFRVLEANDRGLLLPMDATLELEQSDGSLIHLPIARAGTGDPAWLSQRTTFGIEVRFGTGITSYGSRDTMVSLDLAAGPQLQWRGLFVNAQIFARMGVRANATDPERADPGDPLSGDIVSMLGGTIGLGYEVVMADDLSLRMGAGWRPLMVMRDQNDKPQGIHAVAVDFEIAMRPWDTVPHFRSVPRSHWGIYLQVARELGELSGPDWKSGTALMVGLALRPNLGW